MRTQSQKLPAVRTSTVALTVLPGALAWLASAASAATGLPLNPGNQCWMEHLSPATATKRNAWAGENELISEKERQDNLKTGSYPLFNVASIQAEIDLSGVARAQVARLALCPASDQVGLLKAIDDGAQDLAIAFLDYTESDFLRDYRQRTPLMLAARKGLDQVVVRLIEHGATVGPSPAQMRVDLDGKSILHHAIEGGSPDILQEIDEKFSESIDPAAVDHLGKTALLELILDPSLPNRLPMLDQVLRDFADRPAELFVKDKHGLTPVHYAVKNSDQPAFDLLIERGVPLDEPGFLGEPPSFTAIRNKNAAILRKLLEKGADPNRPSEYGVRPLHLAASLSDTNSIRALLEFGADKLAIDAESRTPYDVAIQVNALGSGSASQVIPAPPKLGKEIKHVRLQRHPPANAALFVAYPRSLPDLALGLPAERRSSDGALRSARDLHCRQPLLWLRRRDRAGLQPALRGRDDRERRVSDEHDRARA